MIIYVPNARNPKHQAFAVAKIDLVGFRLQRQASLQTRDCYEDIKKSTAIEE